MDEQRLQKTKFPTTINFAKLPVANLHVPRVSHSNEFYLLLSFITAAL
jgi:hypothetical protein